MKPEDWKKSKRKHFRKLFDRDPKPDEEINSESDPIVLIHVLRDHVETLEKRIEILEKKP